MRRESGQDGRASMALREGEEEGKKVGAKHFGLQCSSKGRLDSLSGSSYAKIAHQTRSHLLCLILDLYQPCLTMLSHWLGDAHVKYGFSVKVVINLREHVLQF